MAYFFGDSFDLYAAIADLISNGTYWDVGTTPSWPFVAGRFAGQALYLNANAQSLSKTSSVNDGIHHLSFSAQQTSAPGGATVLAYVNLFDGATQQCTVVFLNNLSIALTSGDWNGTVLATFANAFPTNNVWCGFEVEVVISNTAGSFTVRKNGNSSNDFQATSLNTRGGTANNYANKIRVGTPSSTSGVILDDFLWRSDASSVAWIGEARCYTRRPTSDVSVAWTPSGSTVPSQPYPVGNVGNSSATVGPNYFPFTPIYTGTITSVTFYCNAAITATMKAAVFSSVPIAAGNLLNIGGMTPGVVLGAVSNTVTNPASGQFTITFPTPASVTAGTQYWIGYVLSASSGSLWYWNGYNPGLVSSTTYASFPVNNPAITVSNAVDYWRQLAITPGSGANAPMVADVAQDTTTTYVSSSTVSQADLYGITAPATVAPIGTVVGLVTRAYTMKSDAGTRSVATQIKSGSTTNQGTSLTLATTWGWAYQVNQTDPNTGSAWTPTNAAAVQAGQVLTA